MGPSSTDAAAAAAGIAAADASPAGICERLVFKTYPEILISFPATGADSCFKKLLACAGQ